MATLISSLRAVASASRLVGRVLGMVPLAPTDDGEVAHLLDQAAEARRAGRGEEARRLYRQVLDRRRNDPAALRGLRDLAVDARAWHEALVVQERLASAVPTGERGTEASSLAALHYELGRADVERGQPAAAIVHFKSALKADREFVPAAVALGDAYDACGDRREAVKTWERTAELRPAPPLLERLERIHRDEGRPSRMIALYRAATDRAPDDLGLAVALGRVYFELEMLDEAADQFEKVEVRASELPLVHAYLGAVFERRDQPREAFEEYRRALKLAGAFEWPQRCIACGATTGGWRDRCPQCGQWNTFGPIEGR